MVDVGLVNVLAAWAAILFGIFIVFAMLMSFGRLVPSRLARVFVFNRASVLAGIAILFVWYSLHHMETDHDVAFGVFGVAFGAIFLITLSFRWLAQFRATAVEGSVLQRMERANHSFANREAETDRRMSSVSDVALDHPVFGTLMAVSIAILVLITVVSLGARGYGSAKASGETLYLVSDDEVPRVALRRYGESVITASFARDKGRLKASISIVPWQSPERRWVRRMIPKDSLPIASCGTLSF